MTPAEEIAEALARRLPAMSSSARQKLAKAYLQGVSDHALARTTGSGPVPTGLGTERAELLAYVSRSLGRLPTEEEIGALLRVPPPTGKSISRTMLAVYDDLPMLALRAAFEGARKDGRGSAGEIVDGYRVKFSTSQKLELAQAELERQGRMWEVVEATGSSHILLVDPTFPIDDTVTG